MNSLESLRAEKTKWEIEILKLKSKLQSGELIELSVAKNVAGIHFNTITSIFKNVIDNEISDICNNIGVSRERLTSIRGKIKSIVNKAVVSSKEKTMRDLIKSANIPNISEDESDE